MSDVDQVRIASPCKASWEDMIGDDRVRFCGQCSKNVYDLSALTRQDAEALLTKHEGNLCVRLYRRADGTVLTADCPTGARAKKRRLTVLAAMGGGLMAAAGAVAATSHTAVQGTIALPQPVTVTQGEVAKSVEEPPPRETMGKIAVRPPEPRPEPQGHWLMGAPPPSRPMTAPAPHPPARHAPAAPAPHPPWTEQGLMMLSE
jgi:hypothetical protein